MPCTFLLGFGRQGESNRARNVEKWSFWLFLGVFDVSKWSEWVQLAQNLEEGWLGHRSRCLVGFYWVLAVRGRAIERETLKNGHFGCF